jgi:hypothetical protein
VEVMATEVWWREGGSQKNTEKAKVAPQCLYGCAALPEALPQAARFEAAVHFVVLPQTKYQVRLGTVLSDCRHTCGL